MLFCLSSTFPPRSRWGLSVMFSSQGLIMQWIRDFSVPVFPWNRSLFPIGVVGTTQGSHTPCFLAGTYTEMIKNEEEQSGAININHSRTKQSTLQIVFPLTPCQQKLICFIAMLTHEFCDATNGNVLKSLWVNQIFLTILGVMTCLWEHNHSVKMCEMSFSSKLGLKVERGKIPNWPDAKRNKAQNACNQFPFDQKWQNCKKISQLRHMSLKSPLPCKSCHEKCWLQFSWNFLTKTLRPVKKCARISCFTLVTLMHSNFETKLAKKRNVTRSQSSTRPTDGNRYEHRCESLPAVHSLLLR